MYAIIHPIEPFDTSIGTEIKFTWKGNQIYKVRCIIKENQSGRTVYDNTISTMKQSYILPPGSGLINGTYYIAYLSVFDVNNKESDIQSIGTPFYCFTKTLWAVLLEDDSIIKSSTYKINIKFEQREQEPLDCFSVTLYTYQKTELSSSGNIYDISDLSHVISGLENAKQYYIRATGKTLHNMVLDTGFILFTVSYITPQIFNTLELNNKAGQGAIEIKSNIVSAIGLPGKDVIFIDHEYADLRDNNVTYNKGFEINGDFTKVFVFREPARNFKIITFGDGESFEGNIYYRIGKYADSGSEKACFELVVNSCGINYIHFSKYINLPAIHQSFALCVNRISSNYDINAVLVNKK